MSQLQESPVFSNLLEDCRPPTPRFWRGLALYMLHCYSPVVNPSLWCSISFLERRQPLIARWIGQGITRSRTLLPAMYFYSISFSRRPKARSCPAGVCLWAFLG